MHTKTVRALMDQLELVEKSASQLRKRCHCASNPEGYCKKCWTIWETERRLHKSIDELTPYMGER